MAENFNNLLSQLRTTNGAGSRQIIKKLLECLNTGGSLPTPWHGLRPNNLVLKTDLPHLFNNEQFSGYSSPYYISEITETNGLQEGSRERTVCSYAIANMFGDIDAAYKAICGVDAYNERKQQWGLTNFKPVDEPFVRL